jgi:hypothetical protein
MTREHNCELNHFPELRDMPILLSFASLCKLQRISTREDDDKIGNNLQVAPVTL